MSVLSFLTTTKMHFLTCRHDNKEPQPLPEPLLADPGLEAAPAQAVAAPELAPAELPSLPEDFLNEQLVEGQNLQDIPLQEPAHGLEEPGAEAQPAEPAVEDHIPEPPPNPVEEHPAALEENQPGEAAQPIVPAAAPADRVRGPGRGYFNYWMDIKCATCNRVCGQLKKDPGPGDRDPPTWYMRVRNADGSWPSKGPQFRRRSVNTFGDSDVRSRKWIEDNKLCCRGLKKMALKLCFCFCCCGYCFDFHHLIRIVHLISYSSAVSTSTAQVSFFS